ncbi:hypothetical protein C4O86_05445 [Pasteurellaceae bacterium 12565]|nr:hypothetical protein C4O86_05445 [Pasteurellaceae bacterium 12565]
MYEENLDYKLSLNEFKSLLSDLDKQIDEKYRESFHCEAVKWIIEYLKEKRTFYINNQERKRLLQEKEVELKKTMNKFMKLEMKKTNQGKKKKRELKERIDTLSLEIDKYMKSSYAEYLETLK